MDLGKAGDRASTACPLRFGQPCNLCHPDAHNGPQDCPTVALVMGDEDLRAELTRRRIEFQREQRTLKTNLTVTVK